MSGGNAEPSDRAVPEQDWEETLSRFEKEHEGARVSVEIEEPGGGREQLESEVKFELGLVGMSEEVRGERRYVRVVIHKHPGATIETMEIDEPTRILQKGDALVVETAGGRRVIIQPFA